MHGGERVFTLDIRMPTSYFLCLASARKMFEKGVGEIPHRRADLFYRCVLRLEGAKLREFLDRDFDSSWCRAALQDASPFEVPLEDVAGDLAMDDANDLEQEPELPALQPAVADAPAGYTRCIARGRRGDVKV